MSVALPSYSRLEDQLNVSSHALGSALALIGTAVLLVVAAQSDDPWALAASIIYGASLLTLFTASSLYHAIQQPRIRHLMQRFDHIAILYLIAGTFTPFALISLKTPMSWIVFGFVWFCAITGTIVHLTPLRRFHRLMVALNLLMGWSSMLLVGPLLAALEPMGLGLLIAGGLTYTLGLVFYLNDRIWLNHFIWHLFVLLGAGLHYVTVIFYVL